MSKKAHEKLIIYQVFPRILTNERYECVPNGTFEQNGSGKLNHYTPTLLKSIKDLGVNCIWYTGIIEHATQTSFPNIPADNKYIVKGQAGSPYAIKDYYDISPALAEDVENRMAEFEALVKRTHDEGLKLFIDFVPNHTARCYHSDVAPEGVEDFGENDDYTLHFSPSNNYYYITNQQFSPSINLGEGNEAYVEFPAKATGNDCFTAFCGEYDWYETAKLNYGFDYGDHTEHFFPIPKTWKQMLDILLFWCGKGVDGFRCDMVFMVPHPFWHYVIAEVKRRYPKVIFIGEIYDVSLYRTFINYCGFDYLYDKVNLYDTLVGIERHNYSAAQLTGCWQTVDGLGDSMLNFLENHDEVRYGSKEFANDPMKIIPALTVSALINRGPFMIYYGQELGERADENEGFAGYNNRSTIFDYWSYDVMRRWYNKGRCDSEKLNEQERWLRKLYTTVLHIAQEKAIVEGEFFDLMYVNLSNPQFNPHELFSFIRYTEEESILIIANFGKSENRVAINIPELAFNMGAIPKGEVIAEDLLSGTNVSLKLSPETATDVTVGARNALILKIKNKSKN